jgi:hypothetical protein
VRLDFEENFWVVIEAQTQFAIRAIDRLAQVMTQARRECS